MMKPLVSLIFAAALPLVAQSPTALVPAHLPGNGLAQHDFMYAGESHDRNIYIVRDGKVAWSYSDPGGKGEISDAVLLSNGNILYTHQFGVVLISPDKKVLWQYDAPEHRELHTALPIGVDHVLFILNGDPALVRVVNIHSNAIEKEFPLAVRHPINVHPQFRHARLTTAGTLLVAHMDLNKVVEYDSSGNELWSFPAATPWAATPLANGNILITDKIGVREVTRHGDTAWSFTPADAPGYKFSNLQQAWRLPNGNTIINNWINEWSPGGVNAPHSIQAIEITPEKKIVWALSQWESPNLGPATTIQLFDQPAAENVHFGEIQ
jgi:hypothetical protein